MSVFNGMCLHPWDTEEGSLCLCVYGTFGVAVCDLRWRVDDPSDRGIITVSFIVTVSLLSI